MSEIRKLREAEPRVETGVTQFGSDWPGVFIRGDQAFMYCQALEAAIDKLPDDDKSPDVANLYYNTVRELYKLLHSSNTQGKKIN